MFKQVFAFLKRPLIGILILLSTTHCDSSSKSEEDPIGQDRAGAAVISGKWPTFDNLGGLSDDGTKLVYVSGKTIEIEEDGSYEQGGFKVFKVIVDIDLGFEEFLVDEDETEGSEHLAAISPAGDWIAFVRRVENRDQFYLVDFDGTQTPKNFLEEFQRITILEFSPDNRLLLVSGVDADESPLIMVVTIPSAAEDLADDLVTSQITEVTRLPIESSWSAVAGAEAQLFLHTGMETIKVPVSQTPAATLTGATIISQYSVMDRAVLIAGGDHLLQNAPISDRTLTYSTATAGTAVPKDFPEALPLRDGFFQYDYEGTLNEVPTYKNLGFGIIDADGNAEGSFYGAITNDGYYCDTTPPSLSYGTFLRFWQNGNEEDAVLLAPIFLKDDEYATTDSPCTVVSQDDGYLEANGFSAIDLSHTATLEAFSAALVGDQSGDSEVYLWRRTAPGIDELINISRNDNSRFPEK